MNSCRHTGNPRLEKERREKYIYMYKFCTYLFTVRDNGLDFVHKCAKVFFDVRTNSYDSQFLILRYVSTNLTAFRKKNERERKKSGKQKTRLSTNLNTYYAIFVLIPIQLLRYVSKS